MEDRRRTERGEKYPLLSDVERVKIKMQVDYFAAEWLDDHGVSQADVRELVDALIWVRRKRALLDRIATAVTITLVTAAAVGVGTMTWQGFVALLKVTYT